MTVSIGDASAVEGRFFDVILANIIRNVLLNDISKYSLSLKKGGILVVSGFFVEDLNLIRIEAEKSNLQFQSHLEKNGWVGASFVKIV
jgi:ribosomal protein L11 methyltransferase